MGRFLDRLDRFRLWRLGTATPEVDLSVAPVTDKDASKWLHEPYQVLWTGYAREAIDIAVKFFRCPEWAASIVDGPHGDEAYELKDGDELLLAHHWVEAAGTDAAVDHFLWLLVKAAR